MGRGTRGRWAAALAVTLGVAAIALVLSRADFSPGPGRPLPADAKDKDKDAKDKDAKVLAPPTPVESPRRVPVGGVPGVYIVMMPDGTSYLEPKPGMKVPLVDAKAASRPLPEGLLIRAARVASDAAKRRPTAAGAGQLVVLETGIVAVPTGAQITLIEKDRVVALSSDGESVVYYADGRVEARTGRDKEK